MPQATPFQSPAWLLPWWRHFSPGTLLSVAVRDRGKLVALAPFYLEEGALGRRLLPLGISLSDFLDVLVDPDVPEAGAALVQAYAARAAGWDSWDMEELAPAAAALSLPCPGGWRDETARQSPCPLIDLRAPLPSGKARKVSQSRNRLSRRGEVDIVSPSLETVQDALDTLFALHGARWRSRGEAGLVTQPVEAFHRDCAPRLLAAGLLRFYLLQVEGRSAAGYLGFNHRDRAYAYLTGFDPDFAFESPMVALTAHAIEEAQREGASEFHFLRGQEAYKYEWGAADRWNVKRSFRR